MRILSVILASALLTVASSAQTKRLADVKFVGTPDSVVDAMLALAHVTAADIVFDLGSGDGRIPIAAAKTCGARGVGIEIEPRLVTIANENAVNAHVTDRVWFLNQDLFESDFSQATVVTLFLMPRLNQQLIPKLKSLKSGTRIVSHMWDMGPEWPPEQSQDVSGLMIYLWTIK